MKRLVLLLSILVAMLMAGGCASSGRGDIVQADSAHPPIPLTVVVRPFEDARPYEKQAAGARTAPPFIWFKSYAFARHDEVYQGSIEPFPSLFAKEFSEALAESGQFEKVIYAAIEDEMPNKGEYDLEIKGVLVKGGSKGRAIYYCLGFPFDIKLYDILWYLGFPKFTRGWDLETKLQVVSGYDGKDVGEPVIVSDLTSRRYFTRYANEEGLGDLYYKMTPLWNDYIEAVQTQLPKGDDTSWVALRTEGQEYLAALARQDELIRKGNPPTFSFLSPAEGDNLRESNIGLRWSATAPGGFKTLKLSLNGQEIDPKISDLRFSEGDDALKSINARDLPIALLMGKNELTAVVTDNRGNESSSTVSFNRLPRALTPANRHALLVGMGASEARDGVQKLAATLRDPFVGQFSEDSVTIQDSAEFSTTALKQSVEAFARKPLADDFAVVYIAVPGDASSMSIGTGSDTMPIMELLDILNRGMAAQDLLLVLEIDWQNGNEENDLLDATEGRNQRWATVVSSLTPGPAQNTAGVRAFAAALDEALRTAPGVRNSVTIEQVVDEAISKAESATGGALKPEVDGRYNRGITMAERE